MKQFVTLLALISTFGCASLNDKGSSNTAYLAESNNTGSSSETIKNNLSRNGSNGMLGDGVSAFPVTGAYIEALQAERGKKNLDSSEVISDKTTKMKDTLLNGKTCFWVRVMSPNGIEAAQFKNWKAKVEQPSGKMQDAAFTNVHGFDSIPKAAATGPMATIWANESFVCVSQKIDLNSEFSLYLIQQIGDSGPIKMTWLPPSSNK